MPPNSETTAVMNPDDPNYLDIDYDYKEKKVSEHKAGQNKIVWTNVAFFVSLHLFAVAGFYQLLFAAQWKTVMFSEFFVHPMKCLSSAFVLYVFSGLGVTMGAHRLWAHRSYKATTPLRVLLMLMNCVAAQNDIIEWSRDHRGHHKWTETNADPHNAERGFFFTHIGWLLVKKHPQVIEKGRTLVMDDITNDPVLVFQKKYYKPLTIVLAFILPTIIPFFLWDESLLVGYLCPAIFRYIFFLNATWCVNSIAHQFGNRPYDANIKPTQNFLTALIAFGEGFHNYHHSFPFDYKTAELPYMLNFGTAVIDVCAYFGLAYDLKTASPQMIKTKIQRSGHPQ